jgi:hypothetical protein
MMAGFEEIITSGYQRRNVGITALEMISDDSRVWIGG